MRILDERVPLVEREDVPVAARLVYEHVAQSRGGRMGNIFKALANSPAALEKVAAVGEFLRFQSTLDPVLRELVILTVAQENHCVYEWTHHWEIAKQSGISPRVLSVVGTPQLEREPDPIGAAVRYARLVARAAKVDDTTFAVLKERLGDAGMVELTVTVGYYGLLARVINTLQVPLEDGVEPRPFAST